MHRRFLILLCAAAALVITLPAAARAQDKVPYGQSRLGLSDDIRDGTLYIPKSYKPGVPMPLLIMLHGFSGWGDSQRSLFGLAEELGFIVITPESRDITWGKEAPGFDQDVRYIGAAFRHVGGIANVDFDRVALGGQSDGAGYALTMGIAYGDTFNHLIVLAGGGLIEPIRRKGTPKVFIAHGVKDSTMPIDVSGRKNVAQLKKEGYDVTYHEHEGGHGTPREIVRESIEWFLGKSQDGPSIASFDHLVPVVSEVPSMAGQPATIYLRERVRKDVARTAVPSDRMVLFVHGGGAPGQVAFDLAAGDHSWAGYLASAGFDAFVVDLTGYGRSTRPAAMDDPCNLPPEQQAQFVPVLITAPCQATYRNQLTTMASDLNDIDAAVQHILKLRGVKSLSMIGWSAGGPKVGAYAAQHPDRVHRLVMLEPSYNRNGAETPPPAVPAPGPAFVALTPEMFVGGWQKLATCPDQVDPAVLLQVKTALQDSDPAARKWGAGVFRFPFTTMWGWNAAVAARVKAPTLIIAGSSENAMRTAGTLRDDLGAAEKVELNLACASHYVIFERNHLLLFSASLEWLTSGSIGGTRTGIIKRGFPEP